MYFTGRSKDCYCILSAAYSLYGDARQTLGALYIKKAGWLEIRRGYTLGTGEPGRDIKAQTYWTKLQLKRTRHSPNMLDKATKY